MHDYTHNEAESASYVNRHGDPVPYFRGLGFHLCLDIVHSSEAARLTRSLCGSLGIFVGNDQNDYLRYMEEMNYGVPGRIRARDERRKAILMEIVKPNHAERIAIFLRGGKYFGKEVSREKIQSILR